MLKLNKAKLDVKYLMDSCLEEEYNYLAKVLEELNIKYIKRKFNKPNKIVPTFVDDAYIDAIIGRLLCMKGSKYVVFKHSSIEESNVQVKNKFYIEFSVIKRYIIKYKNKKINSVQFKMYIKQALINSSIYKK